MTDKPSKSSSKAIRVLNSLLETAFESGPCTCIRCKEAQGDQSSFSMPHTYAAGDQLFNRRFADVSVGDMKEAINAAWLAHYKVDWPAERSVEVEMLLALAEERLRVPMQIALVMTGFEGLELIQVATPELMTAIASAVIAKPQSEPDEWASMSQGSFGF